MDGQKCEHVQCTCYVDLGELYCAASCRQAASQHHDADESPHEACGCRHSECVTG